ncbi:MAG: FtsQ-type POTRA domain-containing protein [Chloroflexota bacterium]|nr:FtsQ-type POTRA domain-containing protein [Chloroflexota bacterium]
MSQRLTFGKITVGRGRRSRRLKAYERSVGLKAAPALSFERERLLGWVRRRLRLFLALLAVGLLGYLLFGTPWFYIYDIEVEGAHLLTKEELYNRSNLEALSIFWLNPRGVAKRLEEDPLVMRAVVSARPPNRVRVQIQERSPVAVWQSGGQSFYVDSDGVLFGLRGDASEMLVVRDLHDTPVEPGSEVDTEAIRTARELTGIIPERRAFDWEAGNGLSFVATEGWRVIFGDHTRLSTKVRAFEAFKEQIRPAEEILLLDLTAPEHPYYRVGQAAAIP